MDNAKHELKRGLKNRHIQLIALGGAIGTGLFLGVAQTIKQAGPSALLGYAIAGLVAFLIMRQLGEMIVDEPVAGSFGYFANKYGSPMAGFVSGWNYWVMYILVSMAELSALGIYVQYWFPEIPTWVSALAFFVLVNSLSLLNVRAFGELEFWFSIVKVAAVVGMIIFGSYLLLSDTAGPQAGVANLWQHGGFFPNGFAGLALSLAVLLMLYPWQKVSLGGSPFVLIFAALDSNLVANVLNLVVLTAALSVYNGCVYANSRMLFGLAEQGNAPRALLKVSARGVPLAALAVSAVATGICICINYYLGKDAFGMLMGLAVAALVINWGMVCWSHMRFRRAKREAGQATAFRSPLFPLTNYLCLAFLAGIVVVMYLTPGLQLSVWLIPAWVALLALAYHLRQRIGPGDGAVTPAVVNTQ
jgi:aromatic amino acid transport protein AroP